MSLTLSILTTRKDIILNGGYMCEYIYIISDIMCLFDIVKGSIL